MVYEKSIFQKRIKKIKSFLEHRYFYRLRKDTKKNKRNFCVCKYLYIYVYISIYILYSNGLDKKRSKSFDANG